MYSNAHINLLAIISGISIQHNKKKCKIREEKLAFLKKQKWLRIA
jgi:hypothetical protein